MSRTERKKTTHKMPLLEIFCYFCNSIAMDGDDTQEMWSIVLTERYKTK